MSGRIAVVDDLALDRERLLNDLNAWAGRRAEGAGFACEGFADGLSLLQSGGLTGRFAIVFLDIRMEGMDGLETARRLRQAQPGCLIVFVTGEAQYALQAYPVHPFDFLVKPYTQERLERLMDDLLRVTARAEEEIDIHVPHGNVTLPVGHIISVVANGHGVKVVLADGGELSAVSSFAEMAGALARYERFLNVNRGVLINMDLAVRIHDNNVQMPGGIFYPLRVREQGELIRRFTQYQIQHRMGGA